MPTSQQTSLNKETTTRSKGHVQTSKVANHSIYSLKYLRASSSACAPSLVLRNPISALFSFLLNNISELALISIYIMGAWTEAPGIFVDHAVSLCNHRPHEVNWVGPVIQACIAALLLLCLLEHTCSRPLFCRRLSPCACFSYRQSPNVEVTGSSLQDTQQNGSVSGPAK